MRHQLWPCDACGTFVVRYEPRGDATFACACGARYDAKYRRLADSAPKAAVEKALLTQKLR